MSTFDFNTIINALPVEDHWGPPTPAADATLNDIPYAPYSKGDKLGRMADWSTEGGKDGRDQRGRGGYNRFGRDQQVYGAGTSSLFSTQQAEDEASFSIVDNQRTSTKTRGGFGRGTIFRGRGGRGGAPTARGGARGGTLSRPSARNERQDGRGARGRGRRFGWKDYDKPQRNRDSSVVIKPDWKMLEEIDFNRLAKLNLETDEGEDVETYGFLHYYDKQYDRPAVKGVERKLAIQERAYYNPTTSEDPVIQQLAEKDEAQIFATDSVLSMLMCAPRSVNSWDIVIVRQGNKLFFDKRDGSQLDFVTVNENAADAPVESDSNKDSINSPQALSMEATFINMNFAHQVVTESDEDKYTFENENPFYNPQDDTDPLASKGYKYRRFDLSLTEEEPVHLIVRTELDAAMKGTGKQIDQFLSIKALNEFDSKAQGSGGALDWRTKLGTQRGAVVATEMKNNSCKLARWTTQAILAKADVMKLGFVSRANPKDNGRHVILGVIGYKPRDFAAQMNLSLSNQWGIVRTIIDMCMSMPEGKYVLVKDPNKPVLRLYEVPPNTFDEELEVHVEEEEE
ncbi:translation initiation factor eIF3 [Terfezia boudieri ATCC MYA-4762]|uniref:Eukaryotic translation initiation factor 3 subunit D n=1 Tax=Terfezia boudieri ATCC MYA-4762 TaxID=1051890 RepID=A0A3N4M3B4_9PEZI|nr:translation initiation factor eIF3 [Terfezia boudieri ATCC MYA-4762]